MATKKKRAGRAEWDKVHAFALSLPDAWEDHPWGEVVAKVRKKVFVFMGQPDAESSEHPIGIGVKLTDSHDHALAMPDAAPSGYGLGKAGWVSVPIAGIDVDLLRDWVEESYRNVAPKTLAAKIERAT